MDEFEPKSTDNSASDELPLELELEEPSTPPEPVTESQQETPRSPFASPGQTAQPTPSAQTPRSPCASPGQTAQSTPPAQTPGQPSGTDGPNEPQIVYYDMEKQKSDTTRLLICTAIFGLIGALCFAGISAVYFSVGRRVGILFIAFFATLGARLGTDHLGGPRVRYYAAFTAGGSAVVAKAFLVLLLFHMYPDFTAEDWTNFANPGKSAAIYLDQSIENALSTDGSDKRSGQEKLDERFEREYRDEADSSPGYGEYSDDEYYDDEFVPLGFWEVLPKAFDVFDLPLILAAMIFAFKFARNERS